MLNIFPFILRTVESELECCGSCPIVVSSPHRVGVEGYAAGVRLGRCEVVTLLLLIVHIIVDATLVLHERNTHDPLIQ